MMASWAWRLMRLMPNSSSPPPLDLPASVLACQPEALACAETGLAPPVVSGAITLLLLLRGWIAAVGPAYLPAGPLLAADLR